MKRNNNKIVIISIISIVFMLGLMYLSNKGNNSLNIMGEAINKISSLIYGGNDDAVEESKLLEENNRLALQVRELEAVKAQNIQLAEMLNLKSKFNNYEGIPAEIMVRNTNNFEKTVVLNVGLSSGVQENMAVVSKDGLFGKIISVSEENSKVQLITDPASKVSVQVGRNNLSVIASGDLKHDLILNMFPQNYNAISGDDIFTSGVGGIFPAGIYIGSVDELKYKPNEIDSYATVKLGYDFNKSNKVLILSKLKPQE